MEEIWKDVINGKYEVSNLGNLVHKRTKKVVKGRLNKWGYLIDSFNIDGKTFHKARHRLVWETFNGEIPKGYEINHKDENPQNNSLSNLNLLSHKANIGWGTHNKKVAKSLTNNPKISKSVVQKSLDGEIIKIWPSTMEIQRALGYSHENICNCCRGIKNHNTAYGYLWQYEEKATA